MSEPFQSEIEPEDETTPKVTIIGGGNTGKTSLIHRFADNDFSASCDPTIFENRLITIEVENTLIELNVWDTAGQEVFDAIIPLTYANTNVGILCYSIADRYSFATIEEKWIKELRYHSSDSEIILVGTKSDLRKTDNQKDCVTYEEGEDLAKNIGALAFLECSALEGKNCDKVFNFIAKHEYHKRFKPNVDNFKKKKKRLWLMTILCCDL